MDLKFIQQLIKPAETKIVLLVLDGLGGLPAESHTLTALEAAHTPCLDALASRGICGLHQPVATGITPGSGPAHLALFGYDPFTYRVGRGVLEALGIDFELAEQDVAARGNFCTLDSEGKVTDRRAGRISTETNKKLCAMLREIHLPEADILIEPVKEHRMLVVFRGKNLSDHISDTDPQMNGMQPLVPEPLDSKSEKTSYLIKSFVKDVREKLSAHHPANMLLLRGFSKKPSWPSMGEVFGLKCAAIASYPMYRGLAKLVGMQIVQSGQTLLDEFTSLAENWKDFDFFYLHVKGTDSAGEDGDYDKKVALIEEVDTYLPRLIELQPDVIIVTGDHSSPSALKSHSWHPVPVILWSEHCRPDRVERFGERTLMTGSLGPRLPAVELLPLALANAMRLNKYGA